MSLGAATEVQIGSILLATGFSSAAHKALRHTITIARQ